MIINTFSWEEVFFLKIKLNGKEEYCGQKMTTLDSFIKEKVQNLKKVVVVHNDKVVKKKEWNKVLLKDNDSVEILKFVGGG